MRRRLAEAHAEAAGNQWEVKLGPGRMMDIELLAQTGALLNRLTHLHRPRRMLARLGKLGWLGADEAATLEAALDRLSAVQQILRLASDRTTDPAELGRGLVELLRAATEEANIGRWARGSRRMPRPRSRSSSAGWRRHEPAHRLPPGLHGAAPARAPVPDVEIRLSARRPVGRGLLPRSADTGAGPGAGRPIAAVHALDYVERVANARSPRRGAGDRPARQRSGGAPRLPVGFRARCSRRGWRWSMVSPATWRAARTIRAPRAARVSASSTTWRWRPRRC